MTLPSQDWLALSDRGLCGADPGGHALLDKGLFVMELALPLSPSTILLNHQAEDGWPRTFAVFHDGAAGLVLLHRQGQSVVRHHLPGPLPEGVGIGRLCFHFDAPARHWQLTFQLLDAIGAAPDMALGLSAAGSNPLPVRLADMAALCAGQAAAAVHPAVLWFGLTRGDAPPARAPWIGLRTPVETTRGPVAAGHLAPGDLVLTLDDGPQPLLAVHRFDLPSKGSFAPVLLRAPFFGQEQDLLIAADQMIALAGSEVEYLFGEDEVLIQAGFLADGRTALLDQRRSVTTSVALEFSGPALVLADGCALLCAAGAQAAIAPPSLPRRSLHSYEALTLMAQMGRSGRHHAA
jgi:hypothetical protein